MFHAFNNANHGPKKNFKTSWSLLGLGVEVGLAPNIMKGIGIFLLSIVWFIFFLNSNM